MGALLIVLVCGVCIGVASFHARAGLQQRFGLSEPVARMAGIVLVLTLWFVGNEFFERAYPRVPLEPARTSPRP